MLGISPLFATWSSTVGRVSQATWHLRIPHDGRSRSASRRSLDSNLGGWAPACSDSPAACRMLDFQPIGRAASLAASPAASTSLSVSVGCTFAMKSEYTGGCSPGSGISSVEELSTNIFCDCLRLPRQAARANSHPTELARANYLRQFMDVFSMNVLEAQTGYSPHERCSSIKKLGAPNY